MLAKTARAAVDPKYSPVVEFIRSQGENPHRNGQINSGNPPTTDLGVETHTTSISASQRIECAPYVFSTDARAVSAFGTSEYRGRPFLIVNNEVRKKLAPYRRTRNGKRGLRAA